MQLKTAHITDIMTVNTHVPRTSSFCWLLQGIFSGILQDERSPTCLLSLEKWDKKMQRRGNCVLLPSQTSLPPSHQPCEKARTRRLPSSSSRCHSGIRLIQFFPHFFCTPALQLGFFSPLVGLYQIPVIFGRKGSNLSWRGSCTSKYRVSGKTAAIITSK